MEGNSGRSVGRILVISINTRTYWLKKHVKTIEEKTVPNEILKVIEIDEPYSFIERKNRIYATTLVSRDKRRVVGYDIAIDKNREKIQNLVDSSPKANKYYSDHLRSGAPGYA